MTQVTSSRRADPPKRVLITGATGFVGANLTRHLVDGGHDVHLLVRPRDSRWRLTSIVDRVTLHEASLDQRDRLDEIVATVAPEWIFHLAAYGAYATQTDVATIVSTNYVGTSNLLEACLAVDFEAFVNTGSSSEYGFHADAPAETELARPNSHYAATKAASTLYCRFVAERYERPVTTLRLYSVYGPWEDPTRLMPTLALYSLRDQLPPLVSPRIARDFVEIDYVVDAFVRAAQAARDARGPIYNVGSGVQTTIAELVELVSRRHPLIDEPVWGSMATRAWDTDRWICDASEFRAATGWTATVSLEDGFDRLARWLRDDPAQLAYYESHRSPPC